MVNILIYRRAHDKTTFRTKGKKFEIFIRVSEYIIKYQTLRYQIPKSEPVQVYITEEAIVYMPENRFNLIESIFGPIITPNGERPFKLPLIPEIGSKPYEISNEEKINKRREAAKDSNILQEKTRGGKYR